MAIDLKNLGPKVSTRDINWHDLVLKAWGSEFGAPDHNTYEFSNNRKFDSTDFGPGFPNGSLNLPIGSFDEVNVDNTPIPGLVIPSPPAETDPYYSSVVLLLHGNAFVNSKSGGPAIATPVGSCTIANAPVSHLGSTVAMAQLSNILNSGGVDTVNTAAFNSAATDAWTLEYSLYITAYPASVCYFMSLGTTVLYTTLSSAGLLTSNDSGSASHGTLALNTWYQAALTYDGAKFRSFLNGTLIQEVVQAVAANTGTQNFGTFDLVPNPGNYSMFRGYIKEVRYTKGVQRYGANYTPRTTPFPDS
jgi:hypothetical protein